MTDYGRESVENSRFLLPTVLGDVLRQWLTILLAGLIAAMSAFIWLSWSWQPEYSMTACYAIMSKATDGYVTYTTGSVSYNVATTFKYLIDSDILQAEVADAMGTDHLEGTIQTEILQDTNIMYLTVKASTPKKAYDIMTAVVNNYQELVDVVLGSVTLDMLEQPVIPTAPNNQPNRTRTVVRASLITMGLVAAILAVLSLHRDTVKSEEDFRVKLNMKRLVTIPQERHRMSQGVFRPKQKHLLINQFPISYQFTEAVELLRTSFEYRAEKQGCKVILVTSTMPNEGKSTVSVNLAISLAKSGSRVIFVDGDLRNPTIHSMLKLDKQIRRDLGEFLQGQCSFSDVLVGCKNPEMYVLAGKESYENASELLGSRMMSLMIQELRTKADYIIVDTPPAGVMVDTEEVSNYADGVILVVRQNHASARAIQDVVDALHQTKIQVLGCVFNNVQIWGGSFHQGYHQPEGHNEGYRR
ncbi:MAG: polysaccharide biosynthesis tyrosine autokinase [Candidatus Onthomonas sp.]